MIELLVLGSLLVVAAVVIGVLATVGALIGGLVLLPFKILGWVFKGMGLLLGLVVGLPLAIVGVLVAVIVGGVGIALAVALLAGPLLPLLLIGAVVWWLLKPRGPRRPAPSGATIVG